MNMNNYEILFMEPMFTNQTIKKMNENDLVYKFLSVNMINDIYSFSFR